MVITIHNSPDLVPIIVGVTIGGFLSICIFVVIGYYAVKRRKRYIDNGSAQKKELEIR